MAGFRLEDRYKDPRRVVVTAHRGFSGAYPENTMMAFLKAVELGVDLLEFDVRGTGDHVPVILHDATLDRTSNGTGSPNDYTLEELERLSFSSWAGPHNGGLRLAEPAHAETTIPTLETVFREMQGKVGLNIQVYQTDRTLLAEVCRLYDTYDLYEQGYLAMSTYREAQLVREINPDIALGILERQGRMDAASLERQKAFGCKYIQPVRSEVTPAFCQASRDLGLYANMFYSSTDEDNRRYIGYGIQGILTDYPDVLLETIHDLGLPR